MPNLPVDVNSWGRSACYPRGNFYPLSDGNSILYRLITKPCFRTCSTCRSHSQAPLCLYTRRMISNHSEGTFGRLRYRLGGDRPSQTTRLTLSQTRIHGIRLESQQPKSGIPTAAPHPPKEVLHSVPPILCISCRDPISSYSKALRGLSVQSRVNTHLHVYYNFAGPPVETVPKSLLHSCGSELTRQGISLP